MIICDYGLPTESKWSLPKEGNKEPLLNVVTTELEVVTAVTSKRRLARFWAFLTADMVGSFSARLNSSENLGLKMQPGGIQKSLAYSDGSKLQHKFIFLGIILFISKNKTLIRTTNRFLLFPLRTLKIVKSMYSNKETKPECHFDPKSNFHNTRIFTLTYHCYVHTYIGILK